MSSGSAATDRARGDTPTQWQQAAILDTRRLTARTVQLTLQPAVWRPFLAGQFIDVRLTAPDGYQAQRSYSIASAPEDGPPTLQLAIDHLPDGEVSPWFAEVASAGDGVEIRGPFTSHFVWRASDPPEPVLLIGGGSGVVPLRAMLRHHRHAAATAPMLLVHAARRAAEVLWSDELLALPAESPAQAVLALSQDQPRRPQDRAGRLDRPALESILAAWGHAPGRVYVCGSNPFVGAVSDALVAIGIEPARIRTERFGG